MAIKCYLATKVNFGQAIREGVAHGGNAAMLISPHFLFTILCQLHKRLKYLYNESILQYFFKYPEYCVFANLLYNFHVNHIMSYKVLLNHITSYYILLHRITS